MTKCTNVGPSYGGRYLMEGGFFFGELQPSRGGPGDAVALRERMEAEGYLYLPGLLDVNRVQAARESIIAMLGAEGVLDPAFPPGQAVVKERIQTTFRPELANKNPAVHALLYEAEMLDFWRLFFGEEVRHFDFTWLRARGPGESTVTPPHCDTVFMNRGTPRLFTAWTPLDDVPYELGGLMVLEGSHRVSTPDLDAYRKMDVDAYCHNRPEAAAIESGQQKWESSKTNGIYNEDAIGLQQELGGRWLGTEYRMGDVLVFGMHTLHAAADNRTRRIRLSTDSRYQRASEPTDERWTGPNPVGHGPAGKRGLIWVQVMKVGSAWE